MNVLVTGGCGFLGSHVCEYFLRRGDSVTAYDNMTKFELARTGYRAHQSRDYNSTYLKKMGATLVQEDIRNLDKLLQHCTGADYIIHTAAQPAMTISIEEPMLDFTTNVMGTINILEAARTFDIPVAICSSIHVYGNRINETLLEEETRYKRNPPAITENHPTFEGTLTPLHASKRAAELYVESFIDSYGVRAAIFRLTGLYGPRQFGGEDHGWVANFAIRILMERPIRIFGNGKQVRDIIYPADVASAFHAFYKHGESGVYNIGGGPDYAISLLECIDLISKTLDKNPEVAFEQNRPGDLLYFICDISKAKNKMKWEPETTPQQGIGKLLEWLQAEKHLFEEG